MDTERRTQLAAIPFGVSTAAIGMLGGLYLVAETLVPDPNKQMVVNSLREVFQSIGPMVNLTFRNGITRMWLENQIQISLVLGSGYMMSVVAELLLWVSERAFDDTPSQNTNNQVGSETKKGDQLGTITKPTPERPQTAEKPNLTGDSGAENPEPVLKVGLVKPVERVEKKVAKNLIPPIDLNIRGKIGSKDPYENKNIAGHAFYASFKEESDGYIRIHRGRDGKIRRMRGAL